MTNEQSTITPPDELRRLWAQQAQRIDPRDPVAWMQHVSAQAAQWGADQELESCCTWLDRNNQWAKVDIDELRDARRPKPSSLQEQALDALQSMRISPELIAIINANTDLKDKYETIRSALEALPND